MTTDLPRTVGIDLGPLVAALADLGFAACRCTQSESFGNFEVIFSDGQRSISIIRDRGQFHVDGSRVELEPVGLWQSFPAASSLVPPLTQWLHPTPPR